MDDKSFSQFQAGFRFFAALLEPLKKNIVRHCDNISQTDNRRKGVAHIGESAIIEEEDTFRLKVPRRGYTTTKEDVGRATWTLLHSIAAEFPEKPSRRQQKDVISFVQTLSRVYPCEICAHHFQKILKSHPPRVGSSAELQQYMCELHNVVNRAINKPKFNCSLAASRWGKLDCGENNGCKIHMGSSSK